MLNRRARKKRECNRIDCITEVHESLLEITMLTPVYRMGLHFFLDTFKFQYRHSENCENQQKS